MRLAPDWRKVLHCVRSIIAPMHLAPDWKRVLRYAWSIRLIVLAAVLSGFEVALPFVDELVPVPPRIFAALSFVTVAGAFIARLVAQQSISGKGESE